jgi:hypothetical protein
MDSISVLTGIDVAPVRRVLLTTVIRSISIFAEQILVYEFLATTGTLSFFTLQMVADSRILFLCKATFGSRVHRRTRDELKVPDLATLINIYSRTNDTHVLCTFSVIIASSREWQDQELAREMCILLWTAHTKNQRPSLALLLHFYCASVSRVEWKVVAPIVDLFVVDEDESAVMVRSVCSERAENTLGLRSRGTRGSPRERWSASAASLRWSASAQSRALFLRRRFSRFRFLVLP